MSGNPTYQASRLVPADSFRTASGSAYSMMSMWLRLVGEVHEARKHADNSINHEGKEHTKNKDCKQKTDCYSEHDSLVFLAHVSDASTVGALIPLLKQESFAVVPECLDGSTVGVRTLLLQAVDCGFQPSFQRLFDFQLRPVSVQRVEGLPGGVERNIPAGDFFRLPLRRNELHQQALTARCAIFTGVAIHANG